MAAQKDHKKLLPPHFKTVLSHIKYMYSIVHLNFAGQTVLIKAFLSGKAHTFKCLMKGRWSCGLFTETLPTQRFFTTHPERRKNQSWPWQNPLARFLSLALSSCDGGNVVKHGLLRGSNKIRRKWGRKPSVFWPYPIRQFTGFGTLWL